MEISPANPIQTPVANDSAMPPVCDRRVQLERLLVRYIVDRYNQLPDLRLGKQSCLARWEAGRLAQPP